MRKRWMKLDLDFYRDEKVRWLAKKKGDQWAYRWLVLCCLAAEQGGRLDLRDERMRSHVEESTGFRGRRLDEVVGTIVEYDLFSREAWEALGVVTSERLARDAASPAAEVSEARRQAGIKSGEARRRKAEERG